MSSEITKRLIENMKKLQPTANKKEKQAMYTQIVQFTNNNNISEEDIIILFAGDTKSRIYGLCELTGKKNSSGKFKESSKKILNIIHDLMYLSRKSQAFREGFVIYEDKIKEMQLEEHYSIFKSKDAEYAKKALELVKVVIEKRPGLEMADYIKITHVQEIKEAITEYDKVKKIQNETMNKKAYYIDKIVTEAVGSLSLEPKTWDDVVKLKNKKLLTTEFLNFSYKDKNSLIDEDKQMEQEYINNFIDPLISPPIKMNYGNFDEEERKKLHLQSENFDVVFFLEKLYHDSNLKQFYFCLKNLESNLEEVNIEDENLIDKNIYKYLDCKKLLDNILLNFKTDTHFTLIQLKSNLQSLQNKITFSLDPLKNSFDLILKSKSSKEIINKFSKYFIMKDKIEHYLKFSNFEELADYLKKINIEIKEISQNRYIYGEFYDYFYKKIEDFKNVLMKIIQESTVPDLVIKHFRYLLEFDLEAETVDSLLNDLKEKMCEKIKNNLEYTENFEIKNFREFFCDEFLIENMNEEFFTETFKSAESFFIKEKNLIPMEDSDQPYDSTTSNNFVSNNKQENFLEQKKKDSINIESIIKNLFEEVKEFLFMMKVLDETIKLKLTHLTSTKNTSFSTIVTEIYFILFEKLKEFLFIQNFDMNVVMKEVFDDKKIRNIFKIYQKEKSDKNSNFQINFDFESDQVNILFKFYEKNSETANTIFNKNFNKNSLQNLSNLIIDLFDLFEVYLNNDTLEMLNVSKNVTIEKIFFSFFNENIINNFNFFKDECTINFFDTHLSIFNFSAFAFTKNFLKNLFKSYRNIIEFYVNILKKTKDVTLNNDIVFQSLFFSIKCFVFKFYDFYETEKITSKDFKRLNCLILEIMKNYNFLKVELKTIIRTIFKNKNKENDNYYENLEMFIHDMRSVFLREYVENSGKILFNLFISSTSLEFTADDNRTSHNNFNPSYNYLQNFTYSYNFYEKYNELLLYDQNDSSSNNENKNIGNQFKSSSQNNISHFSDIRSVLIDMIFFLSECVKELYQIEEENYNTENLLTNANASFTITTDNKNIPGKKQKGSLSNFSNTYNLGFNKRITEILSFIILNFLEMIISFVSDMNDFKKDPSIILSTSNNFSPLPKNFKIISQLFLEIQLFQNILSKYIESNKILKEKINYFINLLFGKLCIIRNKRDLKNGDDSSLFEKEEMIRKNQIIEQYMSKYATYFKCFN